jgi:hypothetical protein
MKLAQLEISPPIHQWCRPPGRTSQPYRPHKSAKGVTTPLRLVATLHATPFGDHCRRNAANATAAPESSASYQSTSDLADARACLGESSLANAALPVSANNPPMRDL